ncbi:MAG: hypothetical protein Fur0022_37460 [Anaerolineales bacterium]
MDILWKTSIWHQFGAAIDDLDNALRACPDELWRARLWDDPAQEQFFLPEFWYVVYHALFWLDLYLTGSEEGFAPPPPFLLVEQNENGPLPEKPYTKDELIAYLQDCRRRCQATIEALTEESAQQRCQFPWGEVSFAELLLYNMRHVVGHAAQLNLLLGQRTGSAPVWVLYAGENKAE